MTYRINGRVVTREEFMADTKGIEAGHPPMCYGDAFASFVSLIDGDYIGDRHALKEHEKKHNVVQVGSDLKGVGNHGKTREESVTKQKGNGNE